MTITEYVRDLQQSGKAICEDGLTEDQLSRYEGRMGVNLPRALRELMLYADGVRMDAIEIQPASGQCYYEDQQVLTFHNWGNGDFTGLWFDKHESEQKVVFVNHNPGALAVVSPSFADWFWAIIDEYQQHEEIAHPIDHVYNPRPGVYLSVLETLRDVECEFRNKWLIG